jgi:hypothetical protein
LAVDGGIDQHARTVQNRAVRDRIDDACACKPFRPGLPVVKTWLPPSVNVAVDFAADEAVQRYRIDTITPCVCGG